MAAKTGQTSTDAASPAEEVKWLDMATGEIVREFGDTVSRYKPGDVEFALYAETDMFEKRNGSKSGA